VQAAEESPVPPTDLARRFQRAQATQVEAMLETLDALGLVRRTDDGRYGV
jgi:DNA-binding IclR family transcriptional regulator